jgi:hypothetical protein
LQVSTTGHNTGDCFLAALLSHNTFPSTPSKLAITNLRAAAGIRAAGCTTGTEIVQLLRHLSYGCVIVQPSWYESHSHTTMQPTKRAATTLNTTHSSTLCVVVAMIGIRHVEPVLLGGTVKLRILSDIVDRLSSYNIEVPLITMQIGQLLADTIVISDDEEASDAPNTKVTIHGTGAGSGSSSNSGSGSGSGSTAEKSQERIISRVKPRRNDETTASEYNDIESQPGPLPCHLPGDTFTHVLCMELSAERQALHEDRLDFSRTGKVNIWTPQINQSTTCEKVEIMRRFTLTLPNAAITYEQRATLVQFCDTIIVFKVNWDVKNMHPNSQLSGGWAQCGLQPCCHKAHVHIELSVNKITKALIEWSTARSKLRELDNITKLMLVSKAWGREVMKHFGHVYSRVRYAASGLTVGSGVQQDVLCAEGGPKQCEFPEVWSNFLPYPFITAQRFQFLIMGCRSGVYDGHSSVRQHLVRLNRCWANSAPGQDVLNDINSIQWSDAEYTTKQLKTAPRHWCHHFGATPRFNNRHELKLASTHAILHKLNNTSGLLEVTHGDPIHPAQLARPIARRPLIGAAGSAVCSASWCYRIPFSACPNSCCEHCCTCANHTSEAQGAASEDSHHDSQCTATSCPENWTTNTVPGANRERKEQSRSGKAGKPGEGESRGARKRAKRRANHKRVEIWQQHCVKIWRELVVPPQSPESEEEPQDFVYANMAELHAAQSREAHVTSQHKGEDFDTVELVKRLHALNSTRPKRIVVEWTCRPGSTPKTSKKRVPLLQTAQATMSPSKVKRAPVIQEPTPQAMANFIIGRPTNCSGVAIDMCRHYVLQTLANQTGTHVSENGHAAPTHINHPRWSTIVVTSTHRQQSKSDHTLLKFNSTCCISWELSLYVQRKVHAAVEIAQKVVWAANSPPASTKKRSHNNGTCGLGVHWWNEARTSRSAENIRLYNAFRFAGVRTLWNEWTPVMAAVWAEVQATPQLSAIVNAIRHDCSVITATGDIDQLSHNIPFTSGYMADAGDSGTSSHFDQTTVGDSWVLIFSTMGPKTTGGGFWIVDPVTKKAVSMGSAHGPRVVLCRAGLFEHGATECAGGTRIVCVLWNSPRIRDNRQLDPRTLLVEPGNKSWHPFIPVASFSRTQIKDGLQQKVLFKEKLLDWLKSQPTRPAAKTCPETLITHDVSCFIYPGNILVSPDARPELAGEGTVVYLMPEYVTTIKYNISLGGSITIIFDAARCKAGTAILQKSVITKQTVRCLARTPEWVNIKHPLMYLADAVVTRRVPACSSSYWELSFTVSETTQRMIAHWHEDQNQKTSPQLPRVLTNSNPSCCQHWDILEGSMGTYRNIAGKGWHEILLGGNSRWQKKVSLELDPRFMGYSVLESYVLKNDGSGSAQDAHQELHCDLAAGVKNLDMSDSNATDLVRDRVLVVMGPAGHIPITVIVWDMQQQCQRHITIRPGQYLVFCATKCWHAGYGGVQGSRLHAMIMPSSEYEEHHKDILMEAKKTLTVSSVKNADALVWDYVKQ